jgi:hypothetical protein
LKHYLLADAGILNFESKKEFPISKMDQKWAFKMNICASWGCFFWDDKLLFGLQIQTLILLSFRLSLNNGNLPNLSLHSGLCVVCLRMENSVHWMRTYHPTKPRWIAW